MIRRTLREAALVLVLAGAALSGVRDAMAQDSCGAAAVSLRLRDTELVDHRGRTVRFLSDLVQAPGASIVSFVYTGCRTYCPPADLVMQMVDARAGAGTRLASVTIDPLNDRPDVLAVRAREMDASERWAWLTGEPAEVFDLLDRVGVSFGRIEDHDVVFLVAGGGRVVRFRSLPDPEQLLCVARGLAAP